MTVPPQLAAFLSPLTPPLHCMPLASKPPLSPRHLHPHPLLPSRSSARPATLPRCALQPGTKLTGRVTNITSYGAFVDLGPHGSGLVHISQISHSFVSSIADHVAVNDLVHVVVISVDPHAKRIALSIKEAGASRATGYERVVQLGGDWGHPWNDDGQARFVELGERRPKGPEAWEVESDLFQIWEEKDRPPHPVRSRHSSPE